MVFYLNLFLYMYDLIEITYENQYRHGKSLRRAHAAHVILLYWTVDITPLRRMIKS